ncbi:hypothetical protein [Paenibacillus silvisoli]|uniref:hypothetical protein n=1 Tax=Paenibacillus silvisoli TaxID=3110539 RepID=UPI0028037FF1|nr:hypothetical protein [Paenibacillus silvisoli]
MIQGIYSELKYSAIGVYTFDPSKDNAIEIELEAKRVRYVRLVVTGNTGWPAAQVSEFEAYAP